MQFKVPQFIDVEDKLFGPFTFHQFAYLAGGAGLIFVIYKLLGLWVGIFLIIPIAILTFLLVFYKINGKPFIFYLEAGTSYAISSKLYIWKQRLAKPEKKEKEEEPLPLTSIIPMTTTNKLRDISWSLDVQDRDKEEGEGEIKN
jgi:hypothetical protein